jgi:pimeloyl-ACP methyl ester carboxylesterase
MQALFVEVFAVFLSWLLRPTHWLPSHRRQWGVGTGRPILLVHGYLHDSSAWVYLKRRLARAGGGPVYCWNLPSCFASIETFAQAMQGKIDQIARECGRCDPILIGHSMGGLVSLWYATRIAPKGAIRDVITIGSPLQGTHMARLGWGLCAREMERGSPFLQRLAVETRANRQIRLYHIATTTDPLIIPYASALFVGRSPERVCLLEGIGHLSLLFSPKVAVTLTRWVNESMPPRLRSRSESKDRAD